jgi:dCTP deaminase
VTLLFREQILGALEEGVVQIEPFDLSLEETQQRIQPASIDLRVGRAIATFRDDPGVTNLRMPRRLTEITEAQYRRRQIGHGESFLIEPGQFMLADVDVAIRLPSHIAGWLEGKSTVGRCGLNVINAGLVEPGFYGVLVLELLNTAPFAIEVASGDDICQIVFMKGEPTAYPYGSTGLGSRYQGQQGAQPPRQRGGAYGSQYLGIRPPVLGVDR